MAAGRRVGIGILGAARVATYAMIAPAKSVKQANLLAVAARDPARCATYAERHGIARVHPSYDALLGDREIDLVYVATPPSLHAKLAIAAISAGKHVLVEKPFAMNAAEAEEVARAGDATGVLVFEAMHSRHHRLLARVVEIVRSGELGEIVRASAHFEAPIARGAGEFRWQRELGGGALMDLGVYPLAWLRAVFGEDLAVIRARAKFEDGVDAEIEGNLVFAGRVPTTFRASMVSSGFSAGLVVEGSTGRLTVNNPLAPQMGHALAVTLGDRTRDETIEGPSSFEAQLAAVCASILDGVEFQLGARDYVRSMAAIDAVRGAAAA